MRLAIASTTLLFAMMAAQATVLSATSNTDVSLVKRAPTNGAPLTKHEKEKLDRLCAMIDHEKNELINPVVRKDDEVERLKATIENLKKRREEGRSSKRIKANTIIARLRLELAVLENQLDKMKEECRPQLDTYRDFEKAVRENNFDYIRKHLWD
ncbi:hypothetical protein BASA50_000300 [Batrachochytrium salamandrivorans]|uniref:RxLR effector protein n=1 Tax=Batrachochytrium salamandrivorans TaxID=1357716 RepID=A0ABQ8EUB0_9FUNG|nr:hypothetical protein BASA60_005368 [Batrachochytrium salamandrivorans]KAH6574732.1 hypothetical protein BASA62_002319 [Batrachochytrium salamandrivorans]KAH6586703.1 hypothetical protein BASA50_000300 [Batrachochytrium salamandrivorans]